MSRTDAADGDKDHKASKASSLPSSLLFFHVRGMGLLPSLLRFYLCFFFTFYAELFSSDFFLFQSPRWKRVGVLCGLLIFVPLLMIINHVGFILDDLLYPQWCGQIIHKPMFIVGNPRSGTTWMHRLMAQEQSLFTSFRTWELLIGASVTWHKLVMDMYCFDQCFLAGMVEKLLLRLETSLIHWWIDSSVPSSQHIHPVGLNQFEEDEWVMLHVFMSQLIMLFMPLAGGCLNPLVYFDQANEKDLPVVVRRQIFRYYKQCVQRHLYARSLSHQCLTKTMVGNDPCKPHDPQSTFAIDVSTRASATSSSASASAPASAAAAAAAAASATAPAPAPRKLIFISKNPAFTMRLDMLYDTFPDCRVVCLLRDPCQSIPSMISYIAHVWETFASPVPQVRNIIDENRQIISRRYPKANDLLSFCIAHYLYPLQHFQPELRPLQQWSFVSYKDLTTDLGKDLTTDLVRTIKQLLHRFRYNDHHPSLCAYELNDNDKGNDNNNANGNGFSDSDNTYVATSSSSSSHRRGSEEKIDTPSQLRGGGGFGGEGRGRGGGDMFADLYVRLLSHQDHQQQSSHGYISMHTYTLEDTCSMTPLKLKLLLSPIYEKYSDKF